MIYLKLVNGPCSCLRESVRGGEASASFIGLSCPIRLTVNGGQALALKGSRIAECADGVTPLDFIGDDLQCFRVGLRPGSSRLCGGLHGSFGYAAVHYVESRLER